MSSLATTADNPTFQPCRLTPIEAGAVQKRGFQGIPGIERSPSGRLWACWYAADLPDKGEGPRNYVILATSEDEGATWCERTRISHPSSICRAFDPCLWTDPSGTLWVFWAQSSGFWDGAIGVWAMKAENDPANVEEVRWSGMKRLCDGIMMNKPTILSCGAWLLPVAIWEMKPDDTTPPEFVQDRSANTGAWAVISEDQGASWRFQGRAIASPRIFDEHMFVERNDGSLWMLIRTKAGISTSLSFDRGITWTQPEPSPIPHINARFFIRRLRSGRLLLISHHLPEGSEPVRSHLTARLSDDDGETWYGDLCLDERCEVSYPDAVEGPDGTIYIVYDRNRFTDREIHFVRLTEAQIAKGDRGAITTTCICRFDLSETSSLPVG